MSVNCIDAAVELANEYTIPLLLIASRRQIDSEAFGGGYVNNFTTSEFSRYVFDRDIHKNIILARDHGGPWQNTREVTAKLSPKQAMQSAKDSLLADLEAGFQLLHIDTSIDIHGQPDVKTLLERNFELYEYAWSQARRLGKEVSFEVGTEEQGGETNTTEEFEYVLDAICTFCDQNHLPRPTFIVAQTATYVMERTNVGEFALQTDSIKRAAIEAKITQLLDICSHYGTLMKAHNVDYLPDADLRAYPRLGIHSSNVAPEFGVAETVALITVLREHKLDVLVDRFLQLAYESRKWEKWMLPETTASNMEKAIIAGHYVFASKACRDLKEEASTILRQKHIELESHLKDCVKSSIRRYVENFNLSKMVVE